MTSLATTNAASLGRKPVPATLLLALLLCLTVSANAATVRGASSSVQGLRRQLQGGGNNMNNNKNNDKNNDQGNPDDEDGFSIKDEEATTTTAPVTVNVPYTRPGGAGAIGSQAELLPAVCPNVVYTDVIVIGAGMAGLSTAARLEQQNREHPNEPRIDYVILESTDRVGGRVRSTTFGVPTNSHTVEDGANWIYGDIKDNPLLDLMQDTGFKAPYNNYAAYVVYFRNVSVM